MIDSSRLDHELHGLVEHDVDWEWSSDQIKTGHRPSCPGIGRILLRVMSPGANLSGVEYDLVASNPGQPPEKEMPTNPRVMT